MSTITEEKTKSKVDEVLSKPYKLILHNDDFNSFPWVIKCLMNICKHEYAQAEQSAHLVHFVGHCDVKRGDFETISDMKDKLVNSGLLATMEKN